MPTIRFDTTGREVTFADGDEVNLLRVAIRNDCGIPFKCASGNCGTDRVRVARGCRALRAAAPARARAARRLLDRGYRLACQTYVSGDVSVAWDPDQKEMEASGRAYDRLKPGLAVEGGRRVSGSERGRRRERRRYVDRRRHRRRRQPQRKVVLELGDDRQLLVLAHDGGFYAFDNTCIHRQARAVQGRRSSTVGSSARATSGRSSSATGWEQIKQECQPTYDVRVVDDVVQVDTSSRRLRRTA